MTVCYFYAFLNVLAAVIAKRMRFFSDSQIRSGLLFGFLGFLAALLRYLAEIPELLIGIRDIPVFLASFCFGPVSGLITGCISALSRFVFHFCGLQGSSWTGALATLVVALYAGMLYRWVFENRPPDMIPAAICAFYGGILHLSCFVISGICMGTEARMLESAVETYPQLPVTSGVAAGLASLLCGSWKESRRTCFSSLVLGLILFSISFSVIEAVALKNAEYQTKNAIQSSVRKLENQFKDQIDFMLHSNAVAIRKRIGNRIPSMREMRKYAWEYEIDELNIFSMKGTLLATSRTEVLEHNRNRKSPGILRPFFLLADKRRDFVKQDFRPSRSEPDLIAKYVGIPLKGHTSFLQLGYAQKNLENHFSSLFFPMFDKTHIEDDGFFVITDREGRVAAPVAGHPEAEGHLIQDFGIPKEKLDAPLNRFFETKLFSAYGQCLRLDGFGDWKVFAFLPYTEFYTPAVIQSAVAGFVLFIIFFIFRVVSLRIARAQKKIDDMRSADLALASTIQNSELPEGSFENSSCVISAKMTPAKEVGGDFYDYYELSDGRICVTIADVSGKGVPAAIFMMKAKNTLKNLISSNRELESSLVLTNTILCAHNDAFMFVTAWIGIFDPRSGVLEYVSAGHNPPFVLRKDGKAESLESSVKQKVLAAFESARYRSERIMLEHGETLFLYTDGVTESMNPKGVLYGADRLKNELETAGRDLIGKITESLNCFIAGAPVADDITMLTLEVKK